MYQTTYPQQPKQSSKSKVSLGTIPLDRLINLRYVKTTDSKTQKQTWRRR